MKENSRMNHMENNPEILRMQETNRKKLSRKKQRHENPEKLKEDQNKWQTKCRLVVTEKGRLHKFLKRTMYNAVFTCCCCQRNLFECNVSKLTQHFISQIETKKPGIYASAIELDAENNPIMVQINGEESSYLCHACKNHLKKGKLPPMSAKNGLKIPDHDPELELTELEGNLIAKSIVFMKIFQLPKSRWTALKDKILPFARLLRLSFISTLRNGMI